MLSLGEKDFFSIRLTLWQVFKNLDSPVVSIGHVKPVLPIEKESRRQVKLTGSLSRPTPEKQ